MPLPNPFQPQQPPSGGTSTSNRYYSYTPTGQAEATAAAAPAKTPEQIAAERAQANANVGATGYQLGSLNQRGKMYDPTSNRPDQTVAERTAEQRANFFYGGSASGRQDAIDSLRGNMNPYTGQLAGYGGQFMGQGALGQQQYGYGAAGLNQQAATLANMANQGPGPSLAQAQLDASTAQGMRQQLALAGSGRGQGGGASAFRQAAANQAGMQGQANASAAMLRAQEQDAWTRTRAGMLAQAGQMYGQGAEMGSRYAGSMGGLGLGAQQAAAQTQMGIEQGQHSINQAGMQGGQSYESLLAQIYGIDRGIGVQNAQLGAQQDAAMWGAVGTGVTTAAMLAATMSDINAKTNIAPVAPQSMTLPMPSAQPPPPPQQGGAPQSAEQKQGDEDAPPNPQEEAEKLKKERENEDLKRALAGSLGQFTTNLGVALSDERGKQGAKVSPRAALTAVEKTNPWKYEYKDPARHGQGTHYGPMAQELAQTPVGRSTLVQMPDGKLGVDTGRLALVNTAAQAAKAKEDRVTSREFAARLDQIEKQFARRAG
jgi:hypothetical protein